MAKSDQNAGLFTPEGVDGAVALANYVLSRAKDMGTSVEKDCLIALANSIRKLCGKK